MRRIIVAVAYLPTAFIFLIICLYLLLASLPRQVVAESDNNFEPPQNFFKFYAALPAVFGVQNSAITSGDARPYILERFIKKYYPDSPLLPYTHYMVNIADRYNLHFALLTAIAMQESNLCKFIPENSRNCWGLGIYGDKVWRFDSYEEAIEEVAKTLSRYARKGRLQPEEIMQLYTPRSEGSWARAVRKFMNEME